MSLSKRKVNTAAFTSALKQVFYIHKNVVSELCAKFDILSDEYKLLKANSHNARSSGRCESCVNFEKINRSQQEHFHRLLHEKDVDINALAEKLQSLNGESNIENLHKQKDEILPKTKVSNFHAKDESQSIEGQELLPKDSDIIHHPQDNCKDDVDLPLETCKPREAGLLHEQDVYKSHTRLSLARQSKRTCHYTEEQREAKRMKMSGSSSERDKNCSVHILGAAGHNDAFFVPDTVFSSQQRMLSKPHLQHDFSEINKDDEGDSENNQSQQILVVPETLAIDNSSYSDNENDMKSDDPNHSCDQKEPVSKDEGDFDHINVDDNFLEDSTDRIDENNMHSVKASSTTDCCVPKTREGLHDFSNNCVEDKSLSFSKWQPESGRSCKNKPNRRLMFQEAGIFEGSFGQPYGDKKNYLKEVKQGILQKPMNLMHIEESQKINEIKMVVEGSPHQKQINNAKTSISSVRNKADKKKRENTNSITKDCPIGQEYSPEKNSGNLPSVISVRQTTLSQTKVIQTSKIEVENKKKILNMSDVREEEKLQMAKAIQRSLKCIENKSPIKSDNMKVDAVLQMAKAIQRSLKCIENKSPIKSDNMKVDAEFKILHCSPDLNFVKPKHKLVSNPRKEIVNNGLSDSMVVSHLLPVTSCAPSELKSSGHEATTRIQNTNLSDCRRQQFNNADFKLNDVQQISNVDPPEFNGSLNPDVHLSEYLTSEIVTERQSQTLANLDETIAPNLISQYMLSHHNQNTSLLARLNAMTNQTPTKTSKKQNSLNNQLPSPAIMTGTPRKRLQDTCRQPLNENKPELKDEWCDSDDDEDDNIFTSVEDDPETIEPSPQQNIHNGSQLRGSIPSISCSFKFIHKQPPLAAKSGLQGTGKPPPQMASNFMNKEKADVDATRSLLTDKPSLHFGHDAVLNIDEGPPPQSLLDSFDRVPKREESEFPHASVVRKKSEREKLEGFSCKQCFEYYKNSGLSEEAIKQKKNECSRHRERYRAPDTPEHFWSLGFPDTAEMLERRQKYHPKESPVAANRGPRRRRPLEKKF